MVKPSLSPSLYLYVLFPFPLHLVPRPRNYPRLVESLISGVEERETERPERFLAIFSYGGALLRGCAPRGPTSSAATPGTPDDVTGYTPLSLCSSSSWVPVRGTDVGFSMKLNSNRKETTSLPPSRAPFRITFREHRDQVESFKLPMHREFVFRSTFVPLCDPYRFVHPPRRLSVTRFETSLYPPSFFSIFRERNIFSFPRLFKFFLLSSFFFTTNFVGYRWLSVGYPRKSKI